MRKQEEYPDLSKHDPEITLKQAKAAFGKNGKPIKNAKLANILGVGRSNINHWQNRSELDEGYLIPTVHAYRLEREFPDKFKQTKKGA